MPPQGTQQLTSAKVHLDGGDVVELGHCHFLARMQPLTNAVAHVDYVFLTDDDAQHVFPRERVVYMTLVEAQVLEGTIQ